MKTLYNLTKAEANVLLRHCENDVGKLALLLWDRGKAVSLESGIKKAKRIKNFANKK